MTTILNLVNTRIKPTGKNYFWYIVVLVSTNLFFHLIYLNIFLSTLFWKIKFIPKSLKIVTIILFSLLMLSFNFFQILYYFNIKLEPGNNSNIHLLVQALETLHLIVFAGFFYCIYNIIFIKYSPFSLIYVGLYNILHAIMDKCPIISLQNFLNPAAGTAQYQNEFWQGFFGDWTTVMRVVISLLSIFMFYVSWAQLKKLKYNFRVLDCYFPWQDYSLKALEKKSA